MAKFVVFALVAMMAVAAFAAPAEELEVHEEVEELAPVRLPRATCDLASAFGAADSLCAAHCIAKRYKGGWCEKGVCHCRR